MASARISLRPSHGGHRSGGCHCSRSFEAILSTSRHFSKVCNGTNSEPPRVFRRTLPDPRQILTKTADRTPPPLLSPETCSSYPETFALTALGITRQELKLTPEAALKHFQLDIK